MKFKSLDLVLPCYNPIPGWEDTIIRSYSIIADKIGDANISLYLVNDGSGQAIGSGQLEKLKVAIPSFHYLSYSVNRGKGYALRYAVKESKKEICIYTDIDFPFSEDSLLSVYFYLNNDEADIVVGNRDKAYYQKVPGVRIIISKVLRFFIRFFLGMKISDTQCGLKGFNEKGKLLFLRTTIDRYLFDLEFVHLASNTKNIRIVPMLVKLKDGVVFSRMNMKVLMTEASGFIKILLKHYLGR
ncbi:MAG: glycosyltransferase family 2 protein [Cytophagaceae bacterium]|jgi:glycosyltransferase involved in cell wall biosynthesis|nr:glycosyltransferase family 2 protein [Cytophagaceae bacterium]